MECIFNGLDHRRIHHLHGGWKKSGGDDVADGVAGIRSRGKSCDQRAEADSLWNYAHPERGDDAEGSLVAADQAHQIERAGFICTVLAAHLKKLAIWKNHLDAEDVIGSDEILERMDATGVRGSIAANRAGALAGGVGGEVIDAARLGKRIRKRKIAHPRLDMGDAIIQIDLENRTHPSGGNDHAIFKCDASTGQSRSRTAWNDLRAVTGDDFDAALDRKST